MNLQELQRAHQLGLNLVDVLVSELVAVHGATPKGKLAEILDVSERTVDRALTRLREAEFSFQKTNLSHDHVIQDHKINRTETPVSALTDIPVDPLREKLRAAEVLEWCIDALLARVKPEVIERQLAFHAHRIATGYKFKGHPAKLLFTACLNDYPAPQGYHEVRARAEEPRPVAIAPPAPQAPEPVRSREELVREGLSSPLQRVKDFWRRRAAEWGLDPAALAG